ncbi:MAG TPA: SDR family oxidoreductase [Candidatus Acidoferrales bacterium]|nr:SDR family oxidoreductase [Candidatus Acidoferrales bacterium]
MAGVLQGQVAIVTGAGRGIGRGIALRFAAEGAAVGLTARTKSQLDQTLAEIEATRGRAIVVEGDATYRADVERIVRTIEAKLGGTTILVNNAGIAGPYGPIGVVDPEAWWDAQKLHILAPMLFMTAVVPGMIARRAGRIILISSPRSYRLTASLSAYSLGKAAQNKLAELVANEAKPHGVACFALDPGSIMTDMADETMNSLDAQRWVPEMVERLHELKGQQSPHDGIPWCTDRCVALASGRYDALSGRYIDRTDDPDEMMRQVEAKQAIEGGAPQ